MEDLFQVGAILDTHGLKGEVKVFPTTDDPKRFQQLKEVIVESKTAKVTLEVSGVRYFKNLVILKFKGIDSINDVEKYKKANLFVTRENAVELGEDEYFIADLIGLKAYTQEDELLGTVTDVLATGANDVYVIQDAEKKELLVPAIHECVISIDIAAGKMVLHLLPGMRELNQ